METGLQPNFWIRTTGFPFEWLDELACTESARDARRLMMIEDRLEALASRISDELKDHFPQGHAPIERALITRALLPTRLPSSDEWNICVADHGLAEDRLRTRVGSELARVRRRLHDLHDDPRVKEAVWMSSRASRQMFDQMLAHGVEQPRTSRVRYREVEAYLFLQRLCAKNDTVSFFGPLGWGRTGRDERRDLFLEAPTTTTAERRVDLEYWAVRALADAINRDPDLAAELPVELSPTCRLAGTTLHYPIGRSTDLSSLPLALVRRAAGQPHADLIEAIVTEGFLRAAATEAADSLLASGVLRRGLFVPTMIAQSAEALRARVAALRKSPPQRVWLLRLDGLLRDVAAFTGGSFRDRVAIAANLEARFADVTGDAAGAPRERVAARSLIREDCRLDGELVLGAVATERIERALAPMVELCRWIVCDVAAGLDDRYRQAFRSLGGGDVDFIAFVRAARVVRDDRAVVSDTRTRLEAAWQPALSDDASVDEVVIEERTLRDVHARLAGRRSPPFFGEYVHAPDVLLAARDAQALRRGDYQIVLGEIHKAVFYEAHPVGWPFCPNREDVSRRLAALIHRDRLRVMDAPEHHHSRGYHLPAGLVIDVVVNGTSGRREDHSIPVSELVVRERDGMLELAARRGPLRTPLLSAMQNQLLHCADQIAPLPLPQADYVPRVRCGDAIVRRRSWRFGGPDLAFLNKATSPESAIAAAARLMRARRLPRRVFVKSPAEDKPVYVDLENPVAIELLIKLARQTESLRLTELYPGHEHLWFGIADRGHTAELRLTYVLPADPAVPGPGSIR